MSLLSFLLRSCLLAVTVAILSFPESALAVPTLTTPLTSTITLISTTSQSSVATYLPQGCYRDLSGDYAYSISGVEATSTSFGQLLKECTSYCYTSNSGPYNQANLQFDGGLCAS